MQYTYIDHCTDEQLHQLADILKKIDNWNFETNNPVDFEQIFCKTYFNSQSKTQEHIFGPTEKIQVNLFRYSYGFRFLKSPLIVVTLNRVSLYINDIIVADNWTMEDKESPLKQLAYQLLQKFVDSRKEKVTESLQRILKTK